MSAHSIMKLLDYKMLKTNFELSQKFDYKNQKINIEHQFNRNIKKIDEKNIN